MNTALKIVILNLVLMTVIMTVTAIQVKRQSRRLDYVVSYLEETEPNSKHYVHAKKRYHEAELSLLEKKKSGFKLTRG